MQSIGQEGQQADVAQGITPEARAMQEKHRLEVASLEQKLSSSLEALEAKNTELRESQRRQESLEAKLYEKEKDALRVAERLAELKTKSEQDLKEALRLMREKHEDQEYSEEEAAILERAQHKFEDVDEADYEHIESPDVFVKMDKVMEEGVMVGIGRAFTVVDATAEDCAAFEWAKMTRGG